MRLYNLIDRLPEFPYFLLALFYVLTTPVDVARQVLSAAFCYMVFAISVGLAIKLALKTPRPREYRCIPIAKYDIPSLHTLVSVGSIVFIYFINPLYAVVFTPVGVLYMYSRIKLGIHTKKAVIYGALIGVVIGFFFGTIITEIDLGPLRVPAAILFFAIPVCASLYRLKYLRVKA